MSVYVAHCYKNIISSIYGNLELSMSPLPIVCTVNMS